jgi:hypothetical protein
LETNDYLRGLERTESTFPTYYTHGAGEKAHQLSEMAEKAKQYLKEYTDKDINATLLILGEDDWRKRTKLMYGVFFEERGYIHFPADTRNPFLNALQPIWDKCPEHLRSQLTDRAGAEPFERCLSGFFEGKVAHELTHFLLSREGINFGQRWFTEFFCDYVNYAFLRRHQADYGEALWLQEVMPQVIYQGGLLFAEYRRSVDFDNFWIPESGGLRMLGSPLNLLWLYAKGMRGVVDLYGFYGERFIREAIDAFKPSNKSLVELLGLVDGELGEWFSSYLIDNP